MSLAVVRQDWSTSSVTTLMTSNTSTARSSMTTPRSSRSTSSLARWVFNTTKLLDFRTGLRAHAQSDDLNKRFDTVYGALTNYQIPVVTLKDLTVEEVCPIFERINSSGTRLSTYDLMVAATWSTSFDLNEEVAEIKDALSAKGFSEIDGDTILKRLAAVHKRSIKKDDVVGPPKAHEGRPPVGRGQEHTARD